MIHMIPKRRERETGSGIGLADTRPVLELCLEDSESRDSRSATPVKNLRRLQLSVPLLGLRDCGIPFPSDSRSKVLVVLNKVVRGFPIETNAAT